MINKNKTNNGINAGRKLLFVLCLCTLLSSCTLLMPQHTEYPSSDSPIGGGMIARHGNYTVQLVECNGSRSNQEIELVLMITNRGLNERIYVGGNGDGTMAIDNMGNTLKPYNFSGNSYEFPTGVTVRVTVNPIKLVAPNTINLKYLKIGLGSSKNVVEFHNVIILWSN